MAGGREVREIEAGKLGVVKKGERDEAVEGHSHSTPPDYRSFLSRQFLFRFHAALNIFSISLLLLPSFFPGMMPVQSPGAAVCGLDIHNIRSIPSRIVYHELVSTR